jgi:nucleotide-binding universal stress UspA family protein
MSSPALPGLSTRPAARYRAVLVPLDGSDEAERALGPAAWLADRFGADLHLIAAGIHRAERFWYENYLDGIADRHPRATPHLGNQVAVVPAIRELAGQLDPCLVCASTHGRSRSAAVLGSTFTALALAGRQPLVAIGPAAVPHLGPDPRRIVACIDGTPPSEQVIPAAAAWARALGCSLSLLTVVAPGDAVSVLYVQRLALHPALNDLAVDAVVLHSSAPAHRVLVDHLGQRPASVVAVTTHARTGVARALVGSEAARITHESPVPVLVQPLAPT